MLRETSTGSHCREACEKLAAFISDVEASLVEVVDLFKSGNYRKANDCLIDFSDNMGIVMPAIVTILSNSRLAQEGLSDEEFKEGIKYLVDTLEKFVALQESGKVALIVNGLELDVIPCLKSWRTFYLPSLKNSIL